MLLHFPPLPLSFDYTSLRDHWFPTFLPCFLLRIPYYIVYSHLLGIYSASFAYHPTILLNFFLWHPPIQSRPFRATVMLPRLVVFCTSILTVLFLFFVSSLFLLRRKKQAPPKFGTFLRKHL